MRNILVFLALCFVFIGIVAMLHIIFVVGGLWINGSNYWWVTLLVSSPGAIGLIVNALIPRKQDGNGLRAFRKVIMVLLVIGLGTAGWLFRNYLKAGHNYYDWQTIALTISILIICALLAIIVGICQLASITKKQLRK